MTDQFTNIQMDATEGAGEGEPASSVSAIEAYVDTQIASFVNLVEDTSEIPVSATSRANGIFYDDYALLQYLQEGGLVGYIQNPPGSGEYDPVPIGWVYVYKNVDANTGEVSYEVWIDEDTN